MNFNANCKTFVVAAFFATLHFYSFCGSLSDTLAPLRVGIQQDTVLFKRCIKQIRDLCPILVEVLNDCFNHSNYWKMQQFKPFNYFLFQNPTKWFSRKEELLKIESRIAFLEAEQNHNASYLGSFRQWLHNHDQEGNYSDEEFAKVLLLVENCLNHYSSLKIETKNILCDDKEQRVDRNDVLLQYYRNNACSALAHCTIPNHFQRNWLSYAVGGTAVITLGILAYTHQSRLQEMTISAKNGFKEFWQEYISDLIMSRQDIKTIAKARDLEIRADCLVRTPDISEEEIQTIVNTYKSGDNEYVLKNWNANFNELFNLEDSTKLENISGVAKILNFPEKFLSWMSASQDNREDKPKNVTNKYLLLFKNISEQGPSLARLSNIRALSFEVLMKKAIYEAELFLKVVVGALVAGVTYKGVGACLTSGRDKNIYQPLQKALRCIHRIYNKYTNNDQPMSIMDEGYCYYWMEQFKWYVTQIKSEERTMLLEDVVELESVMYNPHQKLATIQRMYFNYHFLLP